MRVAGQTDPYREVRPAPVGAAQGELARYARGRPAHPPRIHGLWAAMRSTMPHA
jgi:hypothetical protein